MLKLKDVVLKDNFLIRDAMEDTDGLYTLITAPSAKKHAYYINLDTGSILYLDRPDDDTTTRWVKDTAGADLIKAVREKLDDQAKQEGELNGN